MLSSRQLQSHQQGLELRSSPLSLHTEWCPRDIPAKTNAFLSSKISAVSMDTLTELWPDELI